MQSPQEEQKFSTHDPQSLKWREEKVFIVFHKHGVPLKAPGGKEFGDWVVTPGDKPISIGQTVTWQTIPEAKLELFLPDAFKPNHIIDDKGKASATLRGEGQGKYLPYEAYCDGQLAIAGSAPGIIVDP
jgi:hypothetical protein